MACAVPRRGLLGDVRVRVSNDGGARWSEPSEELTCHDAALPPTVLSVGAADVDLSRVRSGEAQWEEGSEAGSEPGGEREPTDEALSEEGCDIDWRVFGEASASCEALGGRRIHARR